MRLFGIYGHLSGVLCPLCFAENFDFCEIRMYLGYQFCSILINSNLCVSMRIMRKIPRNH